MTACLHVFFSAVQGFFLLPFKQHTEINSVGDSKGVSLC